MKQKLTMRLTFTPAEVLEIIRAKYPEIPPEATLKITWKAPSASTKEAEIQVYFDRTDPPPTTMPTQEKANS